MTKKLLAALAVMLFSFGLAASSACAADLTVIVNDVASSKGKIVLGLYKDAKEWPQGKADVLVRVAASQGRTTYEFKGLAPGRYALTGYHDENDNGKMDYSLLGLPEEGFFFANDASPGLSTPGFDECAITLAQAPVTITVRIQHWGPGH